MRQVRASVVLARRFGCVLAVLLALLAVPVPRSGASAGASAVGLPLFASCVDPTQPDTLISLGNPPTLAFNWVTRQRTQIHPHMTAFCGSSGLLFSRHPDGTFWRFTSRDQLARQVEHMPTHDSRDASLQLYALEHGRLWASADGGLGWQERGELFQAKIESLAVAHADARAIAILVVDRDPNSGDATYLIMVSADAGANWEVRQQNVLQPGGPDVQLSIWLKPLTGAGVPADAFVLGWDTSYRGYHSWNMVVSLDGARSFVDVASGGGRDGSFSSAEISYTQGVLVRLLRQDANYRLERSDDQGKTWSPIPYPPHERFPFGPASLHTTQAGGLLFQDPTGIWYSADLGRGWQRVHEQRDVDEIKLTPYLPATLLVFGDQGLTTVPLADEGRLNTASAPAGKAGDGLFFPETGHNLSGVFRRYWERNGGLAQFGYPKTEPFRELNPADGKVYLVQYFERNRFEYHPELAGTNYEVLLGLLGNQFTTHRQSEPPFQRVSGATQPDAVFFPETGHTLRGAFKPYWEANGGLAMYGYPISEEFLERNDDDGKTYIVQYFERARFEYHEENKGTRYEVLLGLLGNKLLREKGWL